MCGFIIGTACLIGLIVTLARGRGGCGGYGWRSGGCGWGGGYGYGGRSSASWGAEGHGDHARRGWSGGGRWFLRGLFERLDTTPGQEKVIVAALDELQRAGEQFRGEIKRTRADVAKAVRSPGFDEALMGETFARHDQAMDAMRKAGVGAMAKIHEALDERQRERLAEILESGPPFFGGFGGPYRRHAG